MDDSVYHICCGTISNIDEGWMRMGGSTKSPKSWLNHEYFGVMVGLLISSVEDGQMVCCVLVECNNSSGWCPAIMPPRMIVFIKYVIIRLVPDIYHLVGSWIFFWEFILVVERNQISTRFGWFGDFEYQGWSKGG